MEEKIILDVENFAEEFVAEVRNKRKKSGKKSDRKRDRKNSGSKYIHDDDDYEGSNVPTYMIEPEPLSEGGPEQNAWDTIGEENVPINFSICIRYIEIY